MCLWSLHIKIQVLLSVHYNALSVLLTHSMGNAFGGNEEGVQYSRTMINSENLDAHLSEWAGQYDILEECLP